jgi:hypothetical protein
VRKAHVGDIKEGRGCLLPKALHVPGENDSKA